MTHRPAIGRRPMLTESKGDTMTLKRSLIAHGIIAAVAVAGFAIARQDSLTDMLAEHQDGGHEPPALPEFGAFKMVIGDHDIAAGYAKMASNAQPGEPHAFIARMAGTYSCTVRLWAGPDGQDAPPTESKGTAWIKPVLGGRYMQQELATAFLGQPLEGLGFIGFDKSRRAFTSSWMDTMSTSMSIATGSINREGNQLTLFGAMDEPATGEYGKIAKFVYRFVDSDTFVFEAWEVMYGDPWKVFEIEYKRKK